MRINCNRKSSSRQVKLSGEWGSQGFISDTHSSQLYGLGVTAKSAERHLAYSSIETIFNANTHILRSAHGEAIWELERKLFPNVPNFDNCGNN